MEAISDHWATPAPIIPTSGFKDLDNDPTLAPDDRDAHLVPQQQVSLGWPGDNFLQ